MSPIHAKSKDRSPVPPSPADHNLLGAMNFHISNHDQKTTDERKTAYFSNHESLQGKSSPNEFSNQIYSDHPIFTRKENENSIKMNMLNSHMQPKSRQQVNYNTTDESENQLYNYQFKPQ